MTEPLHVSSPLYAAAPLSRRGRVRTWVTVAISISVHIVIIWLVSLSAVPPPAPSKTIVTARLVFPSPPEPYQETDVNPATPPPNSETTTSANSETPAASAAHASAAKSALHQQQQVSEQALPHTPPRHTPSSLPQNAPTTLDPRAAVNNYFATRQQQALQRDSADAAARFEQQKRFPELTDSRTFLNRQEETEIPPSRINCSTGLNKAMAAVSIAAGGTLRCSELGDPAPFIKKRINAHSRR